MTEVSFVRSGDTQPSMSVDGHGFREAGVLSSGSSSTPKHVKLGRKQRPDLRFSVTFEERYIFHTTSEQAQGQIRYWNLKGIKNNEKLCMLAITAGRHVSIRA